MLEENQQLKSAVLKLESEDRDRDDIFQMQQETIDQLRQEVKVERRTRQKVESLSFELGVRSGHKEMAEYAASKIGGSTDVWRRRCFLAYSTI